MSLGCFGVLQIESDKFFLVHAGTQDFEWIGRFRHDGDTLANFFAGCASQMHPSRYDGGELFHLACNSQRRFAVFGIIGKHGNGFCQLSSAIPFCGHDNADFSLAAGRDLPRIRGSRAPSPGFDFGDLQLCRALVLDDIIVFGFLPLDHRIEFMIYNREKYGRCIPCFQHWG